jgi:hypothetical protein
MDASMERMPGDAEAAAAVAGMQDVYGRPLPSVGDWVNGESGGKRWAGRVLDVIGGQRVLIDLDGESARLVAPVSDIGRL